MESTGGIPAVSFAVLQARLRELVKNRIDNGEFTERGFARIVGISQPQMHNILKGARRLSPEIADLMLRKLELSTAHLFEPAELPLCANCRNLMSIPRKRPASLQLLAQPTKRAG